MATYMPNKWTEHFLTTRGSETELVVTRPLFTQGWREGKSRDVEDGVVPPLGPVHIVGTARFVTDSIYLIGSWLPPVQSLSFTLSAFSDWSALEESWKETSAKDGDPLAGVRKAWNADEDGRDLVAHVDVCYKNFEWRPPTLSLISFRDDLTGLLVYRIHCSIPQSAFDPIVAGIRMGWCEELCLKIDIQPQLRSEHYVGMGKPVTYGLLRTSKHYPHGRAHGWVEGCTWRGSAARQFAVPLP